MSEHIKLAIQDLEKKLVIQLTAVGKTKSAINLLSETIDEPPPYMEASEEPTKNGEGGAASNTAKAISVRSDEFFSKTFSASVREVLQMRKAVGLGPASSEEIYEVLKRGGYAFDSRDAENQLRGLNVSISKNSAVFAKLPNGLVALNEWYDVKRKVKARIRPPVNGFPDVPDALLEHSENVGANLVNPDDL